MVSRGDVGESGEVDKSQTTEVMGQYQYTLLTGSIAREWIVKKNWGGVAPALGVDDLITDSQAFLRPQTSLIGSTPS